MDSSSLMVMVTVEVIVIVAGLIAWFLLQNRLIRQRRRQANEDIERSRLQAQAEAERVKQEHILEAKGEIINFRSQTETKLQKRLREVDSGERNLRRRQEDLRRRKRHVRHREKEVEAKLAAQQRLETQLARQQERLTELEAERHRQLESLAGVTAEEAKKILFELLQEDVRHDSVLAAKRIEEEARQKAEVEARKIISQAIQRCAAEHVVESSVSVVDLPSDDMKGRIIGREGRNIRALEQATGVDLIVDDTPEAVILSGFDPLRREIAKLAIERLIKDGRIHPARIEEVVEKTRLDMEKQLFQEGEQIAFELGIHNLAPELLTLLGRLRFRTSYGQNILYHSREVAYLAGFIARELGADVKVCIRAGLLHDIGKAVDREMEGTHLQLGVELAKKHNESPAVIHAIEAHHFDVPFETIEAVLVQAGDAISAARPGARREVLENYVKRLEKLESLASSFDGVAKAFALQAGREVRIIVESSEVSDEKAFWMTKDIAKKIESEMQYPGQIKVTLIREMRVVDYAK